MLHVTARRASRAPRLGKLRPELLFQSQRLRDKFAAIVTACNMRRSIADSDDDGDDEELFVSAEMAQPANGASILGAKDTTGDSAMESLDGVVERSTSSTERLKMQMLSAERHLVTNSAPTAAGIGLHSSSPSARPQKRRHASVSGSDAAASLEKSVKRAKTITYGAKGTAKVTGESAFSRLQDDAEGVGPKTTQSARFTEHSGYHSSAELPAGSLGEAFANHEPAVMFRDTGSTVPDNSFAQQRMIQQALSSKKSMSTSAISHIQDEAEKSSSFPWSASGQPQSARSMGKVVGGDVHGVEEGADVIDNDGGDSGGSGTNDITAVTPPHEGAEVRADDADEEITVRSASKPRASPIVEINQINAHNTKTSRRDSTSAQRSTKGRKRKSDEANDSDPLNSDDKAIGLPQERYQPRPSRRRSTQVVEEAIDYSVRPEGTARAKRTKTAVNPANAETVMSREQLEDLKADVNKASLPSKSSGRQPESSKEISGCDNDATTSPTASKHTVPGKDQAANSPGSQPTEEVPQSSDKKSDNHIFVRPAIPTPRPNAASRSRRSRTTIFEDLLDFTGLQKSPSLSQQQAKRRLAQEDVRTNGLKPLQRKRKIVGDDNDGDDDEDELAKDPHDAFEAEEEDTAPKKRGRGRPAKSKPAAKSAEKVLEDSDGENDEKDEDESDEAPKKRGRGRPARVMPAAETTASDTIEVQKAKSASESAENPASEKKTNEKATDERDKATSNVPQSKSAGKENTTPSPSPEQAAKKPASTPQKDLKPSPAVHSPIKTSSIAQYRVGLSRRRIPSLLKTINPPRPKT